MSAAPVGIFDSGVGGLSVAREIRRRLPAEQLLYFADTAWCPYGGRPLEEIRSRSVDVVAQLVARGAKAVVVACNTASGAALETLRARFEVPIVGLEPAVKPAVSLSANGRVGVLATAATLKTERFERLRQSYSNGVELLPQACPGLVELVEAGELTGERVRDTLMEILQPLHQAQVDTVVLGCTHYPFLRDEIVAVLGGHVRVLDSGRAVARQVERVLRDARSLQGDGEGGLTVLTSGDPNGVRPVVERLWGEPVEVLPEAAGS